jgi:hypothetical protein
MKGGYFDWPSDDKLTTDIVNWRIEDADNAQRDQVTSLNFSFARHLVSLPFRICELQNLQELHVRCATINVADFERVCLSLSRLRKLGLYHANIATIPLAIARLTSLTHLSLQGNRLETVPSQLLALPRLDWLCLEGNPCAVTFPVLDLLKGDELRRFLSCHEDAKLDGHQIRDIIRIGNECRCYSELNVRFHTVIKSMMEIAGHALGTNTGTEITLIGTTATWQELGKSSVLN